MSEAPAERHLQLAGAVPEIPMFEGVPVSTTKLKLTSTMALDVDNKVLRMDDIVRIVVEARISQVHHNENGQGEVERVQTAKALTVSVIPWDEGDPDDTGIIRA